MQTYIKEKAFNNSLLKPCQIEVLDFGPGETVIWLVIHDKRFPDMMFKIHEDVKNVEAGEFVRKYKKEFSFPLEDIDLSYDSLLVLTKDSLRSFPRLRSSLEIAKSCLRDLFLSFRDEQVNVIERTTARLKKSIAKIPEKDTKKELLANTKKIDRSLNEIRRLDEEIRKVRQLVGVTKEIQDWKLLISDVNRLKTEHVPREVFGTEVRRIDDRIDRGLEALNTRIEDLKAIKFWSKRTLLEIALAIMAVIATLYGAGVIKF